MKWFTAWRGSDVRDFSEAIRPELQSLPTPLPSDGLLERILEARASGDRTILPDLRKPRSGGALRYVIPAIIAAALLLFVMPGDRLKEHQRADPANVPDPVASAPFLSGAAYAQETRVLDRPALPPLRIAELQRMRPLSVEYARTWRDSSGLLTNDMHARVTLSIDSVAGIAAWKLVSDDAGVRNSRRQIESETVYVARSDLRLVSRQVHEAPYLKYDRIDINQRFHRDSVTGRMTIQSLGIARPIARHLPTAFGPYLTDALAPVFLMGVPLHRDWSASVSIVGWAVVPRDVFVPIELRVVGEEFVRVPAGRFDCWRLSVRFFGKEMSYWVRKSDGLGVRSLDETNSGQTREVVLVRG
jgi:hypothetical protein